MYIDNKYTRHYYLLINKAMIRNNSETSYVEKHHIIPRCLGGSNKADNLVLLTGKEHFVCHLLLTKMVTGDYKRKMQFALHRMKSGSKFQKRILSSVMYEYVKKEFAKVNPFNDVKFQERMKQRERKPVSAQARKNMSKAWTEERRANSPLKGRKLDKAPWNKGKSCPQTSGENNGFYGKHHSEELKLRFSAERKGTNPTWVGKKKLCVYCQREFDPGNYSQHHGDNCKFKCN